MSYKSQHFGILEEIFQKINETLKENFGLKIENIQWFINEFKSKSLFGKVVNLFFGEEKIKLTCADPPQLKKINSKNGESQSNNSKDKSSFVKEE